MSYIRDHQVFCMVLCLEKSVPLKLEPCPLRAASRMQSWFVVCPEITRKIGWNVVFPILITTPRLKTTTCKGGKRSPAGEGKASAVLLSLPCALQECWGWNSCPLLKFAGTLGLWWHLCLSLLTCQGHRLLQWCRRLHDLLSNSGSCWSENVWILAISTHCKPVNYSDRQ